MLDYHIDAARNLVITRAAGRVTVGDVTTHIMRLMRDPAFKPELNAMIVAADVAAVPSAAGVSAITPLVRVWSRRRAGVKWAFVFPDKTSRDFAEAALNEARLAVISRCFLSESAALNWLVPAVAECVPQILAPARRDAPTEQTR